MKFTVDNLTSPGADPVPGDRVKIDFGDGRYFIKTWPDEATPSARPNLLRTAEFIARFTLDELGAISALAETNAKVKGWLLWLRNRDLIDLGDPLITQPVILAETAGVIGPGRSDEILAAG